VFQEGFWDNPAMGQRKYRYLHWDVFTDHTLSGNQLAVFPDAGGLDAPVMQAIALEMAFSESTFVFPAENSETHFRVRIFTPRAELPMAGHPAVGTAFALAHEGRIAKQTTEVRFGLGIGPTSLALEWNLDAVRFVWMTQHLPEFGRPLKNNAAMAAALGITEADIQTDLPVQTVSCGVPFLFVPLASREAVNRAQLEQAGLTKFCRAVSIDDLAVFVFSTESSNDDATVFSRMFAPGFGVHEDPATGSASGPLGCYLVHHGVVTTEEAARIVSLQGVKMGRPSRIHISIGIGDGRISKVRVGGQAVLAGEGTLQV
jgi:trans-2,3-dihydro-3-hydroxyanthranilate isomerase